MLIGVGDYAHADLPAIPAAETGAHHLAFLLRDPSIWGLPEEHVTVIGSTASVEQVLGAVRDAALGAEDTLLVYFAGHGLRDRGERLYLALTAADADYPQIGTLPYLHLRDVIRQCGYRARHRVTVLDCCYSGLAGGMSSTAAPTRTELAHSLGESEHSSEEADDQEGENWYGDCVLTSAPPTRRSFVARGARLPDFTGELIDTLQTGIPGADVTVSLETTWRRVRDRIRRRGSPEPQHFAQNTVTRRLHLHNRAAISADLVFEDRDVSGKVTIAVLRRRAPSPADCFFDFGCSVPGDMVVVGGGGTGESHPYGALLTASYPSPDRSAWRVSTKAHSHPNPHRVTAYAIGMKIDGLTRSQLLGHLAYNEETSSRAAHPEIDAGIPAGFELISGGFRVDWPPGWGNLATASFPEIGHRWRARSKDHTCFSPATITAFSIALRKSLPGVGMVQRGENYTTSAQAGHPQAQTLIGSDFALTGIGAEATTNEPGQLLWRVEPLLSGQRPGAAVGSKDHSHPLDGTVTAFALGIKIV